MRDINSPVIVRFGLGLIKMQIDEKDNILTISAWTKYVSIDGKIMSFKLRDEYIAVGFSKL